jgi:hypothetical protein
MAVLSPSLHLDELILAADEKAVRGFFAATMDISKKSVMCLCLWLAAMSRTRVHGYASSGSSVEIFVASVGNK